MQEQKDLIIDAKFNETVKTTAKKRAGISYLCGKDTWSEIFTLISIWFNKALETQPREISTRDVRNGNDIQEFETYVRPVLAAMTVKFMRHYEQLLGISGQLPKHVKDLTDDIIDSSLLLHHRAYFVQHLYQYAWGIYTKQSAQWLNTEKQAMLSALHNATLVNKNRVHNFRIDDVNRIVGYRKTPTGMNLSQHKLTFTLHFSISIHILVAS